MGPQESDDHVLRVTMLMITYLCPVHSCMYLPSFVQIDLAPQFLALSEHRQPFVRSEGFSVRHRKTCRCIENNNHKLLQRSHEQLD